MPINREPTTQSKSHQPEIDIGLWPGRMLFILRENMGYSHEFVGNKLGLSVERLTSYESGKTLMPSEAISNAATYFGVLPSAFFKKVEIVGNVDEILDRIAFDYEFEQMLCSINDEQRRKILDMATVLFAAGEST